MPNANPTRVPEGLRSLMKSLTKQVLRERPKDVCEFSAQYFEKILESKERLMIQGYEPMQTSEVLLKRQEQNQVPLAMVFSIIPKDFTELLKEFTKAVLRENPDNLCEFAIHFFRNKQNAGNNIMECNTFEHFLRQKERFLLLPDIKCKCGRSLHENIHQNNNAEPAPTIWTNTTEKQVDTPNATAANAKYNSDKFVAAVKILQRAIRRFLNSKNRQTQTKSIITMTPEKAAFIITRAIIRYRNIKRAVADKNNIESATPVASEEILKHTYETIESVHENKNNESSEEGVNATEMDLEHDTTNNPSTQETTLDAAQLVSDSSLNQNIEQNMDDTKSAQLANMDMNDTKNKVEDVVHHIRSEEGDTELGQKMENCIDGVIKTGNTIFAANQNIDKEEEKIEVENESVMVKEENQYMDVPNNKETELPPPPVTHTEVEGLDIIGNEEETNSENEDESSLMSNESRKTAIAVFENTLNDVQDANSNSKDNENGKELKKLENVSDEKDFDSYDNHKELENLEEEAKNYEETQSNESNSFDSHKLDKFYENKINTDSGHQNDHEPDALENSEETSLENQVQSKTLIQLENEIQHNEKEKKTSEKEKYLTPANTSLNALSPILEHVIQDSNFTNQDTENNGNLTENIELSHTEQNNNLTGYQTSEGEQSEKVLSNEEDAMKTSDSPIGEKKESNADIDEVVNSVEEISNIETKAVLKDVHNSSQLEEPIPENEENLTTITESPATVENIVQKTSPKDSDSESNENSTKNTELPLVIMETNTQSNLDILGESQKEHENLETTINVDANDKDIKINESDSRNDEIQHENTDMHSELNEINQIEDETSEEELTTNNEENLFTTEEALKALPSFSQQTEQDSNLVNSGIEANENNAESNELSLSTDAHSNTQETKEFVKGDDNIENDIKYDAINVVTEKEILNKKSVNVFEKNIILSDEIDGETTEKPEKNDEVNKNEEKQPFSLEANIDTMDNIKMQDTPLISEFDKNSESMNEDSNSLTHETSGSGEIPDAANLNKEAHESKDLENMADIKSIEILNSNNEQTMKRNEPQEPNLDAASGADKQKYEFADQEKADTFVPSSNEIHEQNIVNINEPENLQSGKNINRSNSSKKNSINTSEDFLSETELEEKNNQYSKEGSINDELYLSTSEAEANKPDEDNEEKPIQSENHSNTVSSESSEHLVEKESIDELPQKIEEHSISDIRTDTKKDAESTANNMNPNLKDNITESTLQEIEGELAEEPVTIKSDHLDNIMVHLSPHNSLDSLEIDSAANIENTVEDTSSATKKTLDLHAELGDSNSLLGASLYKEIISDIVQVNLKDVSQILESKTKPDNNDEILNDDADITTMTTKETYAVSTNESSNNEVGKITEEQNTEPESETENISRSTEMHLNNSANAVDLNANLLIVNNELKNTMVSFLKYERSASLTPNSASNDSHILENRSIDHSLENSNNLSKENYVTENEHQNADGHDFGNEKAKLPNAEIESASLKQLPQLDVNEFERRKDTSKGPTESEAIVSTESGTENIESSPAMTTSGDEIGAVSSFKLTPNELVSNDELKDSVNNFLQKERSVAITTMSKSSNTTMSGDQTLDDTLDKSNITALEKIKSDSTNIEKDNSEISFARTDSNNSEKFQPALNQSEVECVEEIPQATTDSIVSLKSNISDETTISTEAAPSTVIDEHQNQSATNENYQLESSKNMSDTSLDDKNTEYKKPPKTKNDTSTEHVLENSLKEVESFPSIESSHIENKDTTSEKISFKPNDTDKTHTILDSNLPAPAEHLDDFDDERAKLETARIEEKHLQNDFTSSEHINARPESTEKAEIITSQEEMSKNFSDEIQDPMLLYAENSFSSYKAPYSSDDKTEKTMGTDIENFVMNEDKPLIMQQDLQLLEDNATKEKLTEEVSEDQNELDTPKKLTASCDETNKDDSSTIGNDNFSTELNTKIINNIAEDQNQTIIPKNSLFNFVQELNVSDNSRNFNTEQTPIVKNEQRTFVPENKKLRGQLQETSAEFLNALYYTDQSNIEPLIEAKKEKALLEFEKESRRTGTYMYGMPQYAKESKPNSNFKQAIAFTIPYNDDISTKPKPKPKLSSANKNFYSIRQGQAGSEAKTNTHKKTNGRIQHKEVKQEQHLQENHVLKPSSTLETYNKNLEVIYEDNESGQRTPNGMANLNKEDAAKVIQNSYRKYKRRTEKNNTAARIIQRAYRNFQMGKLNANRSLQNMAENKAASVIQNAFKRFLKKQKSIPTQFDDGNEINAALIIQKNFRNYLKNKKNNARPENNGKTELDENYAINDNNISKDSEINVNDIDDSTNLTDNNSRSKRQIHINMTDLADEAAPELNEPEKAENELSEDMKINNEEPSLSQERNESFDNPNEESSPEDSLEMIVEKNMRSDKLIEKMSFRRASESLNSISTEIVVKQLTFEEPEIKTMQELQNESLESTQCNDVIMGDIWSDDNDVEIFRNCGSGKLGLQRLHTVHVHDAQTLNKTVTIDETIEYINPVEATGTESFCLDDDTSENIRQKMMAYSLSEADSDYYITNKDAVNTSVDKSHLDQDDDFNISTALLDKCETSTETESTIVSAVTKIQAGARGFLTRKRLRRLSCSTKSSLPEDYKASFGNDAITESLEQQIENEAALKIQKAYRKHYNLKVQNSTDKPGPSPNPHVTDPMTLSQAFSLENSLAARRMTLQRGIALRNDSNPDEDNSSTKCESKQDVGTKKLNDVLMRKRTVKTTAKLSIKNICWPVKRQNSMPVQIETEVFRVIPKHMRKRIKSADNNKSK